MTYFKPRVPNTMQTFSGRLNHSERPNWGENQTIATNSMRSSLPFCRWHWSLSFLLLLCSQSHHDERVYAINSDLIHHHAEESACTCSLAEQLAALNSASTATFHTERKWCKQQEEGFTWKRHCSKRERLNGKDVGETIRGRDHQKRSEKGMLLQRDVQNLRRYQPNLSSDSHDRVDLAVIKENNTGMTVVCWMCCCNIECETKRSVFQGCNSCGDCYLQNDKNC